MKRKAMTLEVGEMPEVGEVNNQRENGISCTQCSKKFVISPEDMMNFGPILMNHFQTECGKPTKETKVNCEVGVSPNSFNLFRKVLS